MNFTPFGGPFPGSIPTATVHQFAAAKFAHNVTAGGQVLGVLSGGDGGVHYLRPVDPNGFAVATQGTGNNQHPQAQQTLITLPISIAGKPGEAGQPQQAVQIQVVNPNVTIGGSNGSNSAGAKYHISPLALHQFSQGILTVYSDQQHGAETVQLQVQHPHIQVTQSPQSQGESDVSNNNAQNQTSLQQQQQHQQQQQQSSQQEQGQHQQVQTHTIAVSTDDKPEEHQQQTFPVAVVAHLPQELILRDGIATMEIEKIAGEPGKETLQLAIVKSEGDKDGQEEFNGNSSQHATIAAMPSSWQSIAAPGSTVADYLSRIPASTLPLSLHHFLKFNTETIKRESTIESSPLSNPEMVEVANGTTSEEISAPSGNGKPKKKKKYKKKPPKPRRPRPGQVHIATALDGTTLFCCPECHMAYPEKELLEQHLVGHKIERRFICDICGAGLKRKEHLERHKLGHNPDRPFICSVCLKGFKRKEHLNLHFVIHSGEKTEVCPECGKGFYRKDHLRKHARSHIMKRVKEELSNQQKQQLQHEDQQPGASAAAMVTTVVLPTAAETGAMLLQHHRVKEELGTQQQSQQKQQQHDHEHQNVSSAPTMVTTVVLPTAAETGAMLLQHHH